MKFLAKHLQTCELPRTIPTPSVSKSPSSFSYLISLLLAHLVTPSFTFLMHQIDRPGDRPKHTAAISSPAASLSLARTQLSVSTTPSSSPCRTNHHSVLTVVQGSPETRQSSTPARLTGDCSTEP
jgi:hypothetical protein